MPVRAEKDGDKCPNQGACDQIEHHPHGDSHDRKTPGERLRTR